MKSIINHKTISLFLAIILAMSTVMVPIYATEVDSIEENDAGIVAVEETEPIFSENFTEDATESTIPLEFVEEDIYEPIMFDWEEYYNSSTGQIDGNKFTTAGEGVYALTLSAKIVEDFDEDCYIYLIESEHQTRKIRVDLIAEDNFIKTIYLPAGYYQVIETGVKKAPTLTFKTTVSAVSLGEDSQQDVEIQMVLNNAENVMKNVLGEWEDKSSANEAAENMSVKIYGVEALKGVQSDLNGVLYYSTSHLGAKKVKLVDKEVEVVKDGQVITEIQQIEEIYYDEPGLGYAAAFGNSIMDADIVLEITKSGVVGQAEFKVSYDGGLTYHAKYYTGEAVEDLNIGLTYNFYTLNDNDELTQGDQFTFHAIESFEVKNSSGSETARITCVGHPTENHDLVVSILSSGGRGVSRVKISDEKNKMETKTYLVPEDGIMLLDDNLTIYFENIEGYIKGVEYKIGITSHDTTIDYTPLIALGIGVVVLMFVALFWLLMKKDKRGDYIVHQYKWKQDESIYK